MRASGWGLNRPDALLLSAFSVVLVGALIAPAPGADGLLGIREAVVTGAGVLRVAFDAPVAAPDAQALVDAFLVRQEGVELRPWAARLSSLGAVELALPAGAYEGDVLEIVIRDGASVRGLGGGRVVAGERATAHGVASRGDLPTPTTRAHVAFLADAFYVFGGYTAYGELGEGGVAATDRIVRVDPGGAAEILPERIPFPLADHAVAVDPRPTADCPRGCVYLVGGNRGAPKGPDWSSQVVRAGHLGILRFDPASGAVTAMQAWAEDLPAVPLAAAFGGDAIYVFGGWMEDVATGSNSPRIFRFDPGADEVRQLDARLPYGIAHAGAAFDPRETRECPRGCVYVLGGSHSTAVHSSSSFYNPRPAEVVRFDPSTGVAVTLPTPRLPEVAYPFAQAAWGADAAWFVAPVGFEPRLVRFDPVARDFSFFPVGPDVAGEGGIASDGERLLLAGGVHGAMRRGLWWTGLPPDPEGAS